MLLLGLIRLTLSLFLLSNLIATIVLIGYDYHHATASSGKEHSYQCVIINDPDEFVKMIEERDPSLKGFFDMLYQSMNPSSKNYSTEISLKIIVMVLCYQIASLRNTHVSSVKNQIALYMSNTGTSTSGINTLANLGIASTYKTVSRKKNEILLTPNAATPFLKKMMFPHGKAEKIKGKPKKFDIKHGVTKYDIYISIETPTKALNSKENTWVHLKEIKKVNPTSLMTKILNFIEKQNNLEE